nr:DUF4129 domain-containing protein [Halorientalis brevis]
MGIVALRQDGTVVDEAERAESEAELALGPDRAGATDWEVPDAAVTNDVYRAWQQLVERVDVADPETTTTREYARRAVDAGLDAAAVERLTELFDQVRYGDAAPTETREQQARDAAERLDDGGER